MLNPLSTERRTPRGNRSLIARPRTQDLSLKMSKREMVNHMSIEQNATQWIDSQIQRQTGATESRKSINHARSRRRGRALPPVRPDDAERAERVDVRLRDAREPPDDHAAARHGRSLAAAAGPLTCADGPVSVRRDRCSSAGLPSISTLSMSFSMAFRSSTTSAS